MRKSLVAAVVLIGAAGWAGGAAAQPYPARPIRVIVPFPPGNSSDIAARTIGDVLAKRLGQSIVVDNRPGATGFIGAGMVAKAPADGHTLLMTSTSFTISTAITASLPYDVLRDFDPVVRVGGSGGMVLIVHPNFPADNLRDFVALLKKSPGKFHYAHIGRGTIQHLTMEMFLATIGAEVSGVPYKGSVQALNEIIGGQVAMMFDSQSSGATFVQGGRVKAIASTGERRSVRTPNVPLMTESGVPAAEKFVVQGWVGMLAPAKTPRAIVRRLNEEIQAITQTPEMKERLLSQGLEVAPAHPAEKFGEFLREDVARWSAAAAAAKLAKE